MKDKTWIPITDPSLISIYWTIELTDGLHVFNGHVTINGEIDIHKPKKCYSNPTHYRYL